MSRKNTNKNLEIHRNSLKMMYPFIILVLLSEEAEVISCEADIPAIWRLNCPHGCLTVSF